MKLRIEGGTVNLAERRVRRIDGDFPITPTETRLLSYLADRAGEVVSREELMREVWGYAHASRSRTLDSTLYTLRNKIELRTPARHLVTERGVGYRFVPWQAPRCIVPGRQHQLELLRAQPPGSVLVLVGPIGVGKSYLANRALPDAAVLDVTEVVDAGCGAALSRRGQGHIIVERCGSQTEQIIGTARRWIREAPELRIVITSTYRPADVEVVEVPPLPAKSAKELAASQCTTASAEEISALVSCLDGLPLPLAMLSSTQPFYTPAQLLEVLHTSWAPLAGAREQMRSRVAEAWQELCDRERDVLAWLSGLPGPLDIETLVETGLASDVQKLHRKSLVHLGEDRTVRVLQGIRLHLPPHDSDICIDQALLARVEERLGLRTTLDDSIWMFGSLGVSETLAHLRPHLAKIARSAAPATAARAIRCLCSGAFGLTPLERLAVVDASSAATHPVGVLCRGYAQMVLGDLPGARTTLRGMPSELPSRRWFEWLDLRACLHRLDGEPDRALALYEQGLADPRLADHPWLEAGAHRGIGTVFQVQLTRSTSDEAIADRAMVHLRKAALLFHQMRDDDNESLTLSRLASVLAVGGRLHEAESSAARAEELAARAGAHQGLAFARRLRGTCLYALGQLDQAVDILRAALELTEAREDWLGSISTRSYLMRALAQRGDLDEALTQIKLALAERHRAPGTNNLVFLHTSCAIVYLHARDLPRLTAANEALENDRGDLPSLWLVPLLIAEARLHREQGDTRGAERMLQRALAYTRDDERIDALWTIGRRLVRDEGSDAEVAAATERLLAPRERLYAEVSRWLLARIDRPVAPLVGQVD